MWNLDYLLAMEAHGKSCAQLAARSKSICLPTSRIVAATTMAAAAVVVVVPVVAVVVVVVVAMNDKAHRWPQLSISLRVADQD